MPQAPTPAASRAADEDDGGAAAACPPRSADAARHDGSPHAGAAETRARRGAGAATGPRTDARSDDVSPGAPPGRAGRGLPVRTTTRRRAVTAARRSDWAEETPLDDLPTLADELLGRGDDEDEPGRGAGAGARCAGRVVAVQDHAPTVRCSAAAGVSAAARAVKAGLPARAASAEGR